jgi:hypothetical protein
MVPHTNFLIMSYFNHAFKKTFVPTAAMHNVAGDRTDSLAAGAMGVFYSKTNLSANVTAGALTATENIFLAQKSHFSSDTVGNNPAFGGYQETYKSKMINPRYVNGIVYELAQNAQECVGELTAEWGQCFPCESLGMVRIDVKGSPALRLLNHNLYRMVQSDNVCCKTAMNGYQDPVKVLVDIANAINGNTTLGVDADPLLSKFMTATVNKDSGAGFGAVNLTTYVAEVAEPAVPANYKGKLILTAKSVTDLTTNFADCSFDPRDMFELEPIKIIAGVIDETGEVCTSCGTFAQTAEPQMATGSGEGVLRDLILTNRYRQFPLKVGNRDFARMRETEMMDDVIAGVTRTAIGVAGAGYNRYFIKHSVPRFNNPTGVFDNDQYVLEIACRDAGAADGTIDPAGGASSLITRLATWAAASNITVQDLNSFNS